MGIQLPNKCLRNAKNCEPLAQIQSCNGVSFICVGLNDGSTRKIDQDVFTHCWKNAEIDEISDWDEQDLIDTVSIMSQSLSIFRHMKNNK